MKTNSEQKSGRSSERGNVLVYVLIAIVLFAALNFTLSRQTDSTEAGALDQNKAELYATELITYAANVKEAYDKMEFSGARLEQIDFTLPSDAAFNTAPTVRKIFHPDGGGLNLATLPEKVGLDTVTDPVAGWYLGRFNDVEWTELDSVADPGNYQEIILTAYGIAQPVCAFINQKITGEMTIPSITQPVKEVLVPQTVGAITHFVTGTNRDLTTDPANTTPAPICPECHNRPSFCVEQGGIYGFYTVIANR